MTDDNVSLEAAFCRNVLATHGRALHFEIITKMVNARHDAGLTSREVLYVLTKHPHVFTKLEPGVYWLAEKREGRTYPELVEHYSKAHHY